VLPLLLAGQLDAATQKLHAKPPRPKPPKPVPLPAPMEGELKP
jgi:PTH1 family peptidyl-tRNA hydrolase